MTTSRKPLIVGVSVGIAALAGFFAWLAWFNGSVISRAFLTSGRGGIIFTVGIIAILAAVVLAIVAFQNGRKGAGWLAIITSFIIAFFIVLGWFRIGYDTDHKYAQDIKTTKDASLSYDDRTPYEVATASAAQNLESTNGELQNSKHLADEGDHGTWDALIVKRGNGQGYESIQTLDAPLYGQVGRNNVKFCKFDANAKLRLGGFFPHNNLNRAVLNKVPLNVTFYSDDAYGYCTDNTPYVAVPLQQVHGLYAPTWSAYGVAVYNGKTGQVAVYTTVKAVDRIPGPTYPITLSDSQRGGLSATGSYADHFFGRVGYNPSSSNADIQLRVSNSEKTAYVTPLNPKGSSKSIVGTVSVGSKFTGSNKRNPLMLNKLSDEKSFPSISAQEQQIQNNYSNLNGFANSNGGFEFFEVVPGKDGTWTASIGRNQTILYRATLKQENGALTISLYDANGDLIHGLNNTDGTDTNTGTDDGTGSGTATIPGDFSNMTTDQVQQLVQQGVAELAKRAGENSTPTATATPSK